MEKDELKKLLKIHPNGNIEEYSFKKNFFDFYLEIQKWSFPENFKFSQKLYHYFNNDSQLVLGLCPVCGKRCNFLSFSRGYSKHCCHDCVMKDKNVKDKMQQTCINKYGVKNYAQTDECKEKMQNTSINKYGVKNYAQTDECKEKMQNTCLETYGVKNYSQTNEYKKKVKETCQKLYGVDYYSQTDEYKEKVKETSQRLYGVKNYSQTNECREKVKTTCFERYGVENYTKTQEYQIKQYKSKKEHNTFNTSKVEQEFKKYLIDNDINFIYQYKSNEYPFNCDFYFPEYKLYFEIQGSWTHGIHPFDFNNIEDIKILNKWMSKSGDYYKNAIKVWTERDPLKRKIAKENNLNWVEVFSKNINIVIDKFINTISKLK